VATAAAGPAGPVQVNVPFREPLLPDGPLLDDPADGLDGAVAPLAAPFTSAIAGRPILDDDLLAELAALLGRTARGLIVAGPEDDGELPEALAGLARATGFPILADPLSGMRAGPHDRSLVVTRADQLVRPGGWIEAHRPDLVIRTGAMPTSKPILQLLERTRPGLVVIDGDGGWREPALLPAMFVHADAAATARALTVRLGSSVRRGTWTRDWTEAERAAARAMDRWLAALDEPFEGSPFPALAAALPDGAVLWAGNSMPVRDLDGWLPSTERAITVRSNRGANGIDGVTSSALGAALATGLPTWLLTGELALLHDLGGLYAARRAGARIEVVCIDNGGGGIFDFLPVAEHADPELYERHVATPAGVAVADSFDEVRVLRSDRARNVALHRELVERVSAQLG
jgi:2-succinyl-5-enolpyruvyl-6-hydroxy-3-cyclohexene-1-carboxylate synthase